MTAPIEARCEVCNKLFRKSEMAMKGDWHLCPKCPQPALPPSAFKSLPKKTKTEKPKKYKAGDPETWSKARCEVCYKMRMVQWMTMKDGVHSCMSCALEPTFAWFACSVYGSDNKARTAILGKAKDKGMSDKVKRVIIPKRREGRQTMNRYDVVDDQENVLGQVSATDSDEALHKAKQQFNKPAKKTAFRPDWHENFEDTFKELVPDGKDEETGFPIFKAMSDKDRVMGRLSAETAEKAKETAEKMYGKDKKEHSHARSGNVRRKPTEVKYVRLQKQGGKKVFGNKRAMPGYVLIYCAVDEQVFREIQETPGVATMLPYNEPVDFDDLEDEDYTPWKPVAIEGRVAEEFIKKPTPGVVTLNFAKGDTVHVAEGAFKGQEVPVLEVLGSKENPQIKVQCTVFGRPTPVILDYTLVRKV